MKLKKKVALVTGASSGIGRASAIAFAKEGCSVIINYKTDSSSARRVLQACNAFSEGNMMLKADIANQVAVKKMMGSIKKSYKTIDVLISNAGIFDEHDSPTNIKAFENVYRNNLLSCVLVTKYALQTMRQGKIVNVSSIHGRLGYGRPEAIAYSAFKAAIESYTKNLAKKLAPRILVNAIAPGRVATAMWGNPNRRQQKELGKAHLIKRMIQPEEIADGIVFLVKNDAVCGEVLTVDGGMSLVTLG